MRILFAAALWRGSNDSGFVKAFSRLGHLVDVVDEHYYINLWNISTLAKASSLLSRKLGGIEQYNKKLKLQFNSFKPNLVFVYKGQWIQPETLIYFKQQGCKVINFYPDVSFTAHGSFIPKCIPLYDAVFSTKLFSKPDALRLFNYDKVFFIPHGFDPEIHRPINKSELIDSYFCDVSFIGTFSPSKNKFLTQLILGLPQIKLHIWGNGWEKSNSVLQPYRMKSSVHGDLYAMAIQASKINLGLLSEKVLGASNGDQITSRTFHIPGSGGFLLHQDSDEVGNYFRKGSEADFFKNESELVEKVDFYLNNPSIREQVRLAGHNKIIINDSIDNRARRILDLLNEI